MRRLSTIGLVLAALGIGLLALPAGAQDGADDGDDPGFVQVIEVSGLIDPIEVDFITRSLTEASNDGALALLLQLNSRGAALGDDEFVELAEAVRDADIPIGVWIGPSDSQALAEAAELAGLADHLGMAPGTRIGQIAPGLAEDEFGALFGENRDLVLDDTVNDGEALEVGIVERQAPTVGDFAVDLPGFETRSVPRDGIPRREPVTETRFRKLPLGAQLFHTAASPPIAYLLFVFGLALIVFEYFTAGVGIAAVIGAGALVQAGYGLAALPTRGVSVLVLAAALLAFAVDIQTGVPRFWTAAGGGLFVVGTLTLYDGLSLSWVTLVAGFGAMALFVLVGMPTMVRTRFSTPTIGREWMLGENGVAVGGIDPDGTVMVRDALWRARVNRATPIEAGDEVLVVGLDGLVLEVEPPDGAARDYRER